MRSCVAGLLLATACGVLGCADIHPIGDTNALTADEQLIGPGGGELNVLGARLIVPPGALDEETAVRVARVELPQALPDYARAVSGVYALEPQTVADAASRFSFAVTLDDPSAANPVVLTTVEGCGAWLLADSVVVDQVAQGDALVTTLIKFGVFVVVDVDAARFEAHAAQVLAETGQAACLGDDTCLVQTCAQEEDGEEVECELTPDSGVCSVTGVCAPLRECACLQAQACNFDAFGCRTPATLSSECAVGLDVLASQDAPYDPALNPNFESDE